MTQGMIVCPQPLAAKVGLDTFRDGGNAFDAAVAAAFTQGIVDPGLEEGGPVPAKGGS